MTLRLHARPFMIVSVCLLWLGAAPLMAASPAVTIMALQVDIWPEHDDPRVLVIYRGTLSADVSLPYTLEFPVPADADVHAAAYRREGQLLTAPYQTTRSGDQARISFRVPVPDFQFEYYVDVLTPPPQRTFMTRLVFPLPVVNFQVSVEQPLRSSDFSLAPSPTSTAAAGGFTYHLYAAQPWPAGRVWTVRGSYRKDDAAPSLAPASLPATAPGASTERSASLFWLLPALIGAVAGVGGTLLVAYFRRPNLSRRPVSAAGPRRQSAPTRHNEAVGQQRFCPHCGRRAGSHDRFCSNCGQPLPEG